MVTRSSLILLLVMQLYSALYGQNDSTSVVDTLPHTFVGLRAATSPIATGFELKYVRDVNRTGEEFSVFFSGFNTEARQFCSKFTDSSLTNLFITDDLPFDPDVSRYEITVRRRAFFAARYSNISYSNKRTFGFRKIFGLRLTHWQVETASRPYFPQRLFDKCGQGDGLFSSSPGKVDALDLVNNTSSENHHMVYSVEAGLGFNYRTSPLRRLMLILEANVFGLIPFNQAILSIDSPRETGATNYTIETRKKATILLDLGIGFHWRLR